MEARAAFEKVFKQDARTLRTTLAYAHHAAAFGDTKLAKTILNATFEQAAEDVFQKGSQAQAICYTTSEHRTSVEEFLAKSAKK